MGILKSTATGMAATRALHHRHRHLHRPHHAAAIVPHANPFATKTSARIKYLRLTHRGVLALVALGIIVSGIAVMLAKIMGRRCQIAKAIATASLTLKTASTHATMAATLSTSRQLKL